MGRAKPAEGIPSIAVVEDTESRIGITTIGTRDFICVTIPPGQPTSGTCFIPIDRIVLVDEDVKPSSDELKGKTITEQSKLKKHGEHNVLIIWEGPGGLQYSKKFIDKTAAQIKGFLRTMTNMSEAATLYNKEDFIS